MSDSWETIKGIDTDYDTEDVDDEEFIPIRFETSRGSFLVRGGYLDQPAYGEIRIRPR